MNKDLFETIIENQKLATTFETVVGKLRSDYDSKKICKPLDVISVNKKLGLDPLHEIGFLIAYYNEL
jgi:nitrous oxide reductase